MFAIATPVIYVICEMRNWPLFTYHPGTNRVDLGWAPAVRDEGPAMYWYGWTATTLIGAAVLGLLATMLPESVTRKIPLSLVWIVPLAGGAGPDLRAALLLAVVAAAILRRIAGRAFGGTPIVLDSTAPSESEADMSSPDPNDCARGGRGAGAALRAPAFAGGDDYDAANDTEGKGPAYFGFVRDTRGSPVSDARVDAAAQDRRAGRAQDQRARALPQPRQQGGRARTTSRCPARRTATSRRSVLRRTPPGATDMHIETNCTLQRL